MYWRSVAAGILIQTELGSLKLIFLILSKLLDVSALEDDILDILFSVFAVLIVFLETGGMFLRLSILAVRTSSFDTSIHKLFPG